VRKTPLFAPFIYKNDHFTKTGSGQNIGKVEKRVAFSAAYDDNDDPVYSDGVTVYNRYTDAQGPIAAGELVMTYSEPPQCG
jgi:hypothetical protein